MRVRTLTAERLRELLAYDPETGIFTWRVTRGKAKAGDVAGSRYKNGRPFIRIDGVAHQAHRLAWLFVTGKHPETDIDHWDRDPLNTCFANLRPCTSVQNQANRSRSRNNTSGFKCVEWNKRRSKWEARFRCNGKVVFVGRYDCPVAAHLAYAVEAERRHGEFARAA